VHGLTTPCFVFEAMAKDIVAKGHRVLVYDHYGRGSSDRPRRVQDRQFFVEHLHELLDALGEKDAFDLIGYSMGCVMASAFGADHPERVKHLILLAPAGMGHELDPMVKNALCNHRWNLSSIARSASLAIVVSCLLYWPHCMGRFPSQARPIILRLQHKILK